jgi:hypothetical protein
VKTPAIQKVLDCINGKAKDKKLEPADFVACFDANECTYELVMSQKSLHLSCYTASPKKCELPRVILNCGKAPQSMLASFNLCPHSPNHVEVAEQVGADPRLGRILGMSKFPFPWDKQRGIGDVLIKSPNPPPQGCFGGACHDVRKAPLIANDGVPYLDTLPHPESVISNKSLTDVCKCLTEENFDKIVFYPDYSDGKATNDATKENIAVVRALCGAFGKVEFKQKEPPKKP